MVKRLAVAFKRFLDVSHIHPGIAGIIVGIGIIGLRIKRQTVAVNRPAQLPFLLIGITEIVVSLVIFWIILV